MYEIAHRHVFDHRARNAQTKAADQQATIEAKILIAFIVHCHGAPSFLAFAQQLSAFQTKAPYRQIASVRFCAKLSSASCRDYAFFGAVANWGASVLAALPRSARTDPSFHAPSDQPPLLDPIIEPG
jgi:hypothetical protein